jgi:hypothetical protein
MVKDFLKELFCRHDKITKTFGANFKNPDQRCVVYTYIGCKKCNKHFKILDRNPPYNKFSFSGHFNCTGKYIFDDDKLN